MEEEDREGGETVGAMGAPLLLGLHHLAASRVLGSAVVRSVVEADGDIHRLRRRVPPDLPSEAEGDGLLDPAELAVLEEPSSGAVGVSPTALGSSAMDRGARNGGSEQQVGGIVEGRGPERSAESALREGEEPGQRGVTNLTIAEDPRSPSGSVGRRVFLSVPSSLRCGRKTAAAAFGVHTETSALFPSSTSNSRGKGGTREHPENSSAHVRRLVANHLSPRSSSLRGVPKRLGVRRSSQQTCPRTVRSMSTPICSASPLVHPAESP